MTMLAKSQLAAREEIISLQIMAVAWHQSNVDHRNSNSTYFSTVTDNLITKNRRSIRAGDERSSFFAGKGASCHY